MLVYLCVVLWRSLPPSVLLAFGLSSFLNFHLSGLVCFWASIFLLSFYESSKLIFDFPCGKVFSRSSDHFKWACMLVIFESAVNCVLVMTGNKHHDSPCGRCFRQCWSFGCGRYWHIGHRFWQWPAYPNRMCRFDSQVQHCLFFLKRKSFSIFFRFKRAFRKEKKLYSRGSSKSLFFQVSA